MTLLPRGAVAPTAPKRARVHFLDDRNKTGVTGFDDAPEQFTAQMAECLMKSNRTKPHAGHAIDECRRTLLLFVLTRAYVSVPDCATDVRGDAAMRKFRKFTRQKAVNRTRRAQTEM